MRVSAWIVCGGEPGAVGVADGEDPVGVRDLQQAAQLVVVERPAEREAPAVLLERADRLLQRLLERAADRHDLADRLHLGRQRAVGLRELLERPARDLDHAVVDGRLEATPASRA